MLGGVQGLPCGCWVVGPRWAPRRSSGRGGGQEEVASGRSVLGFEPPPLPF